MLNLLKEIGEPANESYYKEHVEKLFHEANLHGDNHIDLKG
jgi:hypothetical protein